MEDKGFACQVRVRYQETDQMKVVYHANYLTWFEMGRTELIRHLGFPYSEVEKRGLYLPVVDVRITYKKPAYYDDIVTIYTRINELSAVRIGFAYEIYREANNKDDLLVTGFSNHVWVNRDFKPVRLDKMAPDLFQLLLSLQTQPKRS